MRYLVVELFVAGNVFGTLYEPLSGLLGAGDELRVAKDSSIISKLKTTAKGGCGCNSATRETTYTRTTQL